MGRMKKGYDSFSVLSMMYTSKSSLSLPQASGHFQVLEIQSKRREAHIQYFKTSHCYPCSISKKSIDKPGHFLIGLIFSGLKLIY